jgi:hypothetical protein
VEKMQRRGETCKSVNVATGLDGCVCMFVSVTNDKVLLKKHALQRRHLPSCRGTVTVATACWMRRRAFAVVALMMW